MNYLIIWIMFAHWAGDFVLQSGWMATNKSKNLKALFLHAATYTTTIIALISVIFSLEIKSILLFGLLNGVMHFGIDGITSRITSHLWQKKSVHYFFVMIGFDQFLHFTALCLTMHFFLM